MVALSTIPMALSLNPYGVNWLMYVGLFFFGAGQGFVASQSSNIIAGAVNARDAQQSRTTIPNRYGCPWDIVMPC